MLRFGPEDGPLLLILPPLFEEANRTRYFLVEVMRGLAATGIGSILPDLPGTNDSPIATVEARLGDWRAALGALPDPSATVAVRGGAILDDAVSTKFHWRLCPETGARLLRDMLRSTTLTVDVSLGDLEVAARTQPTALAGNRIHPELFVALEGAVPGETGTIWTVRMKDDPGAADSYLPGTPLWRRAEPGHDPGLAEAAVADIAQWMTSCGVR
jgi:hypothetical protein